MPPAKAKPASAAAYVPSNIEMSVRLYTSPVALALLRPKSTSVRPSMENGISLPWKLSFPSPQVTPIPAAIDRLSMVTVPEGLGLSAAAAFIAIAATNAAAIIACLSVFIFFLLPFYKRSLSLCYGRWRHLKPDTSQCEADDSVEYAISHGLSLPVVLCHFFDAPAQ